MEDYRENASMKSHLGWLRGELKKQGMSAKEIKSEIQKERKLARDEYYQEALSKNERFPAEMSLHHFAQGIINICTTYEIISEIPIQTKVGKVVSAVIVLVPGFKDLMMGLKYAMEAFIEASPYQPNRLTSYLDEKGELKWGYFPNSAIKNVASASEVKIEASPEVIVELVQAINNCDKQIRQLCESLSFELNKLKITLQDEGFKTVERYISSIRKKMGKAGPDLDKIGNSLLEYAQFLNESKGHL